MPINQDTQLFGSRNTKEADLRAKSKRPSLYGLNFPVKYTDGNGYFSKMSAKKLYQRNITQLINTVPGERFMLPRYGLNLKKYLFEPKTSYLIQQIKSDIEFVINSYAPWVVIRNLVVDTFDRETYGFVADIIIKLYLQVREEDGITFEVELKV